jgi:DNA-binding response OmpR family regulator
MAALHSPKRGTVLVADDDPVMRLLMLEMLAQVDLDAIEAADGPAAIACFQQLAPDLVLLDVDMPQMDGFAVCRAIRALETSSAVPIIMVTGGDDLEAVTHAYEEGATDFVSKPINWPILGHRVLYVLRASDAIARLRVADAHNRAVLAAIPDTFFRLNRDASTSTTNRAMTPAPLSTARTAWAATCATCCPPRPPRTCWNRCTPCWPPSRSARSITNWNWTASRATSKRASSAPAPATCWAWCATSANASAPKNRSAAWRIATA